MTKIPHVDTTCIGCSICSNIAPHTFAMHEANDGVQSQVIDPHGDDEKLIQEAIDMCPVMAIHWRRIEEKVN